jgi:Tol biopolymer transport system component/predicted Ser/Thr protein kinase
MTPERWRQIDALVQAVRGRTSAQREALLAAVDPELQREVEALLAQETATDSALTRAGVGSQLGPHKLEASIGKGGMGEVFRAVDTRLGRKVAIKISSRQFDERFEREARAISALNHPHICTLYDVGPNYLVMELLEGETLAARLKKGKLSIADTLRYGSQIADALAEAHAHGITHRDLKPGNIMLAKSGVKVLDFGLAKLQTQPGETITATNVVMGTPAYMAPEQLEGKEAGPWTDIYALGLVLHEMAAGKRPQRDQPAPLDALPPQFAQVIERCLAHDPDDRWQSARDLKAALELIAVTSPQGSAPPKTGRQRWLIPGLVAAALLAAVAAGYWLRQPPAEKPFRFSMLPPEGTSFLHVSQGGAPALSPDGLRIAFVAQGSSGRLLWVRSLDGFSARSLAGTEGATSPFWSPDGHWIGFFAQGNLKKVDPEGGEAQFLASGAPSASLSGSWNAEDKILYYPNDIQIGAVLKLMNGSGGQPVQATFRNNELLDENHYFPSFLPDGRQYLFEVRGGPELDLSLWLGAMGSNDRRLLLKGTSNAQYAPPRLGAPGYLVFARNGGLMAQPFDAAQGALFGTAVMVAEHVAVTAVGNMADFAVSHAGVLAYRTADPAPHEMIWYDRSGKVAGTIGDRPGNPRNNIRISPDGKAIAFTRQAGETQEVWIHDLVRGVSSRLTLNGGRSPVWSPDSSQIAFVRGDAIYRMPVTGGAETVVWHGVRLISANDWSGDGKYLLFTRWDEKGVRQTWLLSDPLAGDSKNEPVPLANGIHSEFAPATGAPRWVSYDRAQVSVRGMPGDVSGPWQVSTDGGNGTRFRRDGRQMYFTSGQSLMAVDVDPGPTFRPGAPYVLFPLPRAIQAGQGQYAQGYDVNADGSKFLATFPAPETPAATITVLKNWQAALGK